MSIIKYETQLPIYYTEDKCTICGSKILSNGKVDWCSNLGCEYRKVLDK
ncbi:MAG TPA: hypothetical protein HA283_00605 [Nanoarchaeota archaeon]|nr:hypothetical protein [Nanoarchaeota archaeon]